MLVVCGRSWWWMVVAVFVVDFVESALSVARECRSCCNSCGHCVLALVLLLILLLLALQLIITTGTVCCSCCFCSNYFHLWSNCNTKQQQQQQPLRVAPCRFASAIQPLQMTKQQHSLQDRQVLKLEQVQNNSYRNSSCCDVVRHTNNISCNSVATSTTTATTTTTVAVYYSFREAVTHCLRDWAVKKSS